MKILFTNITLASRSGTELFIRDVGAGLQRLGHSPSVYSPLLGEVAEELRAARVPVVDRLEDLPETPDLIHGHHHPETMTALLFFQRTPAVYFCHDSLAWHDWPPRFPRIFRYAAVDEPTRARVVAELGVPPDAVPLIFNAVDLERFRPRPPLPPQPRRALLFDHHARRESLTAVETACRRRGLSLDVFGAGTGTSVRAPETLLGRYDLVLARARSALEALAVGTSVVICDSERLGPLVTSQNFDRLRGLNFGRAALETGLSASALADQIGLYDAADAAEVSKRVRRTAGLETLLDRLLALYGEVLEAAKSAPLDPEADERAAAVYLRACGSGWKEERELESLRAVVETIAQTATWRLRERLLRVPGLERFYRSAGRILRGVKGDRARP